MAKKKAKGTKKQGRPRIELSEENIKQAETMAALGMNLDTIAQIIGLSPRSLDAKIAEDKAKFESGGKSEGNLFCAIEKGRAKGNVKLAQAAFEMATSGKHAVMTIFLSKVRLGWRENASSGDDDKPFNLAYPASGGK